MADTILDTSKLGIQTLSSTEALDLFDDDVTPTSTDPKEVKKIDEPAKAKPTATKEPPKEVPKAEAPPKGGFDLFDEEDEEEPKDDSEDKPLEKVETVEEETEGEDVNVFSDLSKQLLKMGIFNLDEDEENLAIDNPKAFGERWELEASKKASDKLERFLNSRGQEALDWFDAVFNKGVKPKEYMQAYADVQDFSTADLTQEAAQERIVREFLKDQDFEAEDIEAELARVRNMGDLEETSKRYQKA